MSKRLADKLFIFQYPLKPTGDGYDSANFIKTAIKPEHQEVTIEVEINTHDPHYDVNRGQAIAANAETHSKRDEEDDKLFDRFVYNNFEG